MYTLCAPDERDERPLTAPQIDLLRRIVATNGGGVSRYDCNHRVVKGLMDRHLIQGKSGAGWNIVHTRHGLETVRALAKKETGDG